MEGWQWLPIDVDKISGAISRSVEPRSSRPSLAVLRLKNLSKDEDQEYFVSGICEDLQSSLSKSHLFDVIAGISSFSFDPQAVEPQQVGRLLNVRYVVQGSVRKAGNRIRVSANLVDTELAKEIWADRFDSDIEDIFDLQDNITAALSSAIIPEITRAEIERTRTIRISSLSSWDHYLRALPLMQQLTYDANREAVSLLTKSNDQQPRFSSALAMLARCHVTAAYQFWGETPESELALAQQASDLAISADPDNPTAYDAKAAIHVYSRDYDAAILAARRAIELDPSLASSYGALAAALAFSGNSDEALAVCHAADHISPRDPDRSQPQDGDCVTT